MQLQQLFGLTGKKALVTGASRGLGQAIAMALAEAGAEVLCASSAPGGSDATVAAIRQQGGLAQAFSADLADSNAVIQLAEKALDYAGHLDILVNCGGTISRTPAVDFAFSD